MNTEIADGRTENTFPLRWHVTAEGVIGDAVNI